MKVYPDTNVLISAFLTDGVCRRLIEDLAKSEDHQIIVSVVVLEEARRVLSEKFAVPPSAITKFENSLRGDSELQSEPVSYEGPEISDPDDVLVLASALGAEADAFVTGDGDLLSVSDSVDDIEIISPNDYVDKRGV